MSWAKLDGLLSVVKVLAWSGLTTAYLGVSGLGGHISVVQTLSTHSLFNGVNLSETKVATSINRQLYRNLSQLVVKSNFHILLCRFHATWNGLSSDQNDQPHGDNFKTLKNDSLNGWVPGFPPGSPQYPSPFHCGVLRWGASPISGAPLASLRCRWKHDTTHNHNYDTRYVRLGNQIKGDKGTYNATGLSWGPWKCEILRWWLYDRVYQFSKTRNTLYSFCIIFPPNILRVRDFLKINFGRLLRQD